MQKRLLLLFVSLFLICAANATTIDGIVQVPKAAYAPEIDAQLDDIWKNVTAIHMENQESAPPDDFYDLYANWRMMWDDTNIYLFYACQDDWLEGEHANPWERDSFEFYFDADLSQGENYDGLDDIQLRIALFYETAEDMDAWFNGQDWDFYRDDIEFAVLETENGWQAELKMPLENVQLGPEPGWEFGFEMQNNDNDSDHREHIGHWMPGGDTHATPAMWGVCALSDHVVGDMAAALAADFTPTIDGTKDEGWLKLPLYSSNTFAWSPDEDWWDPSSVIDYWSDHYFNFQLAWDVEKLYIFIEKYDDVIIDEHANPWEQDGVEIYFDGGHSAGETFDGIDDLQIRFNHWYTSTDDITLGYGTGADWGFAKENVEFAVAEADSGFTIEIAMPMGDLGIDAKAGSTFGFEIQSNDNDTDARDAERKWWASSNNSWQEPQIWGSVVLQGDGTAVNNSTPTAPAQIELAQNYPNPFNPTTQIHYAVSQQGLVKLTVYNLLGHAVASLVDKHQSAGIYSVQFDASGLASGVYLYKLETGSHVLTRKMVLTQ